MASSLGTTVEGTLLDIDHKIPLCYFVSASLFSWLLLAGYLISPSTYASIQQTDVLKDAGAATKSVFRVVRNLPLLVIASVGCLIATTGLAFVSFRLWANSVWVKRYVVLPVLSNSAIGLLSTILRIYAEQGGEWSITAVITGSIILAWFTASGALFVYIEWVRIPELKGTLESSNNS